MSKSDDNKALACIKRLTDPSVARRLLDWYQAAKRSLPWRELADDPYSVLVSEMMLQQTTVASAIGHFNRWMERFPNVYALAVASLDEVLTYWSGLGYYARARNLHKAAKLIALLPEFPRTADELRQLPGIGRYTSSAVASIAFHQPVGLVDANVKRVYCRVFGLEWIKSAAFDEMLWTIANASVSKDNPRDFNQALMEVGALICDPVKPNCSECPLAPYCDGYASGSPAQYGRSPKKSEIVRGEDCAVAIENAGRVLLLKRSMSGVWAGFWEFPRCLRQDGETLEECASRSVRDTLGAEVTIVGEFGRISYTVMNRRIALTGFDAVLALNADEHLSGDWMWASEEDISRLPMSSPQKRLLALWRKRHAS
jgi:A/G-specific adenine glycosylase